MSKKLVYKKEYKKPGTILTENKALLNYIYDYYGFRTGVVVILPGEGKHHPKIGWALFEEVPHRDIEHTRLLELPKVKGYDVTVKNTEEVQQCIQMMKKILNINLNGLKIYETTLLNEATKSELIQLAINRANFNSWDFYVCRDYNLDQSKSDLRENLLSVRHAYLIPTMYPRDVWEYEGTMIPYKDTSLCNSIRKAVRQAEYRAWRYFK